MAARDLRARGLAACTALIAVAAAGLPSTATATAAPKKATFEVKFAGEWGALWYAKQADGEPHHVCLAGEGAEGSVDLDARTVGRSPARAGLYLDRARGHVFGRVRLGVVERRSLDMGGAIKGCDEEHAESTGLLDCERATARWGDAGGPPAWLDVAAGRGGVSVSVDRDQTSETINGAWRFCPFWGAVDAKIEGTARLSTAALLSGRPQTVRGRSTHDHPAGEGQHAQEGRSSWTMTIRYVRPRS
jgi:hypothetical protein